MPYTAKSPSAGTPTEYSVYVYYSGESSEQRHTWAKTKTTTSAMRAVAEARKLHASRKYPRIEIKKKAFDAGLNQPVDTIFKVYQEKTRDFSALKEIALLTAAFCFGLVCVCYFILSIQ